MEENKKENAAIQWERVYKKIESHAFLITGLRNTVDENGSVEYIIGAGFGPLDLVQKVFRDYLKGKVKPPDPDKPLTEEYLVNLLKAALEKDFLDLLKSSAVETTDYAEEIAASSDEDREGARDFFDSHRVKKIPGFKRHRMLSDPLPEPDYWTKYQNALRKIYDLVKGEPDLEEMIRAIGEHDLRWPIEIAERLETTVEDINNRQKKLRRRFKQLLPVERKKKAM
jgi:hypothetical protein